MDRQRDARGRFVKGSSGNPAGRTVGVGVRADFNRWAATRLLGWLERLEALQDDQARALTFLIEHAMGKAAQYVEVKTLADGPYRAQQDRLIAAIEAATHEPEDPPA